jgi:hypothetical protein
VNRKREQRAELFILSIRLRFSKHNVVATQSGVTVARCLPQLALLLA